LVIFNADGTSVISHEIEAVMTWYQAKKIPQHLTLYDQFVHPLIFWDGHGGCGLPISGDSHGATALIWKELISLALQGRDHFIHKLITLREEFICSISGRFSNLRVKFLANAQEWYVAREDEIRADIPNDAPKEHGMRTFIPSPLTDSNEYWREVATKCFAISTQFGAPTVFLTFTMNPSWLDFQALKRGYGLYSDSAIATVIFGLLVKVLMKFVSQKNAGNCSRICLAN
jgi:hypothetical protein